MSSEFQVWSSADGVKWDFVQASDNYWHASRIARDRSLNSRFERVIRTDMDNLLIVTFRNGMAVPNGRGENA
jgi:hypothetical protein